MESSINCEQNGNGIWLDLFIWLTRPEHNSELEPHTTLGAGEITKLKERRGDERLLLTNIFPHSSKLKTLIDSKSKIKQNMSQNNL